MPNKEDRSLLFEKDKSLPDKLSSVPLSLSSPLSLSAISCLMDRSEFNQALCKMVTM